MPNPKALASLPPAPMIPDLEAYLVDEKSNEYYTFVYNPESIEVDRSAVYKEAITALRTSQAQQYSHTTGRTKQYNELLLDGWADRKSIRPILAQLESLLVPNIENNEYRPPIVRFIWGTESFGPAVLTSLSWKETAWLGGEPAVARVNITLLEVPESDANPVESGNADLAAQQDYNLTDRQKEDARKAAQDYLKSKVNNLPEDVRDLVRANRYRWSTAGDGTVKITDASGENVLATVGRWNPYERSFEGALEDENKPS